MKTYLLLLFAIVSSCLTVEVAAQSFCGTSPNYVNTLANYSVANKGVGTNSVVSNCTSITVRLQFHIIRNTDGSGGQPSSIVNTVLNNLANAYNQWGIYFVLAGSDEINNSYLYKSRLVLTNMNHLTVC